MQIFPSNFKSLCINTELFTLFDIKHIFFFSFVGILIQYLLVFFFIGRNFDSVTVHRFNLIQCHFSAFSSRDFDI